jgi:endonuclease/exonuclease/phosphatase family metal-dependent hydrolase
LEGSALKGKKLALPKSNHWDRRIGALKEAIDKIIKFAPNSPYFLALQEVTPQSLDDLKEKFPDLNWISYNTTTAEETSNDGREKILGEFLSFTATLGLSKELQVVRQEHQTLPSVSGSLRRMLGVEVYHKTQKRSFAIFTIHTDYLVQENLYERNVQCISEFVQKFSPDLPFICGGDLNAFESNGGNEYIEKLKKSAPFAGAIDYREGPFYSAPQIAYSTFLGHALDSFKAPLIENNGAVTVQPNALDHIFLNGLHLIYSVREAAVYDENGHIIDPFTNEEAYVEGIKNRKTVSDHFLNAVLFSL